MIGFLGLVGQGGYNIISANRRAESIPRPSIVQRLAESKWVPLKALSDQQYEEMLNEKLLKIEVEVSLIDEKIAALKSSQEREPISSGNESVSSS